MAPAALRVFGGMPSAVGHRPLTKMDHAPALQVHDVARGRGRSGVAGGLASSFRGCVARRCGSDVGGSG